MKLETRSDAVFIPQKTLLPQLCSLQTFIIPQFPVLIAVLYAGIKLFDHISKKLYDSLFHIRFT